MQGAYRCRRCWARRSNKIAQTSFKDGSNGSEIRTTLRQDRNGTWVALTVDGSMWEVRPAKDRWIKGPVSL